METTLADELTLGRWVHQQSGHLGSAAISKQIKTQRETCQIEQQRKIPCIVTGELAQGTLPAQI